MTPPLLARAGFIASGFRRILKSTFRLAYPTVSPNTANLVWTPVANATGYNVYIDGVLVAGTFGAPVLNTPGVGVPLQATLSWSAVPNAVGYNVRRDGTLITPGVTAPVLAVPNVSTVNQASLSWSSVTGAVGYNVYRDGVILAPVVTASAPGAPVSVTATGGVNSATVSFTPPANNGTSTITGFVVTSGGGPTTTTQAGTSSPITISNLLPGMGYTFTVQAINSVGPSQPSAPSNTVTITAPPPTAPVLAVPDVSTPAEAILSWTAISSAVGYNVYRDGSLVTGASAPTAPGIPTTVNAVPSAPDQATVSWVAPASNGGAVITGYSVTSAGGPTITTIPATASPLTISSLAPGTGYTFTVTATNSAGTSGPSAPSAAITIVLPAPVLNTPNVATATKATLSWAAVANAVGYNVYRDGTKL